VFTADSRFVAFAIAPLDAELDKARKAKKKPDEMPKGGVGVVDLSTRMTFTADKIKSFKVPKLAGAVLAYLKDAAPKSKEEREQERKEAAEKEGDESPARKSDRKKIDPGTELVVRDLSAGTETSIADVSEYAWSDTGTWLAYALAAARAPSSNGLGVRRMQDGVATTILMGEGHYKKLTFDDAGTQLAFVTDRDAWADKAPRYALYRWTPGTAAATQVAGDFTDGDSVSEHGALTFSKDGARLFFGTAARPVAEPDDASDAIKVDLWHWKDPQLQTMQKVRLDDEKKRSYRAVYHVASQKIVPLASPSRPDVSLTADGTAAMGASSVPYYPLVSWDGDYSDAYTLDLQTGTATKVAEKLRFDATISPGGKFLLYFDDRTRMWTSIDTATGSRRALTTGLAVSFDDETWDSPGQAQPYGVGGWLDGDRGVLVYDRFDIWELAPDGSRAPRMVTNGAGRRLSRSHRVVRLDPDQRTISPSRPLLVTTIDDTTKASGFARIALDAATPQDPAVLLVVDKAVGGVVKAKDVDTLVFTQSRFDEFPDLWQSTTTFTAPKKISDANPQQAQYTWGRSELISYTNADGKVLRAILTKPSDFDPAKKYPLMVYIYEELTNGLHRYVAPAPGTSINATRYVSNGYVLLQPDIVYDEGYPGESAYKCVMPAVQKVVDMGFVDPKRIGIQGHSWGGYQISYLITKTDMFRAVEAGASVVNMTSAYGGIRWGTGMSRAFQYEKTQSRIGGPPWQYPLQFIENSPLFWIEKVKTPYLTIHNDDDDAVPWYQGIEFFSALRRLGKEAYLFNYNGEKHGLRERENQKHWTIHMDEFFDHYLLGAPRPAWMEKGVPYLERGTRDVRGFYKKPTDRE
ncbi:MAG: S9 family peptidase, partial [Acidobacteria bacterium]|nr:S9 family peptidase [Acidobacteriota bacterium]